MALGDRPTLAAAYTRAGVRTGPQSSGKRGGLPKQAADAGSISGRGIAGAVVSRGAALHAIPEPALLGIQYPCVLKPIALSASQGVVRANNREEFIGGATRLKRLLQSPEIQATREANLDCIFGGRLCAGKGSGGGGIADGGAASGAGDF